MTYIFMTVDTEGDNLWEYHNDDIVKTKNALYIPRFQELCEKYGIVPVYLTNYEMAMSDSFVDYISPKAKAGLCEIGMHVHAWNSPPVYPLGNKYSGNPYIIEYPKEIIYKKHKYLKEVIYERFGIVPVTYRSGRWATNDELFDVLDNLGFCVDCSITPGIHHSAPGQTIKGANNYRKSKNVPYRIRENLWEVPMTTDVKRKLSFGSPKKILKNVLRGEQRWLRPALQTVEEMDNLIKDSLDKGSSYIMFMIHSSELMPNGSPYCRSEVEVEEYLDKLDSILEKSVRLGKGCSLKDYYQIEIKAK